MPDGARKTVYHGNAELTAAETVKRKIQHIVDGIGFRGEVDPDIPRWLALHPKLAAKLAKVGLVSEAGAAQKGGAKLAAFVDRYIAGQPDVKPNTVRTWEQTRELLVEHFGAGKRLAAINELDAKGFHKWLSSVKNVDTGERRFSNATVTKHTSNARQFFAAAVDARLISANPFRGIKLGRRSNKARQRFIDRETIERVLDGCPDPEFRLVIALSRYGGLRIPSELEGLLWQHVDRQRGRILVTSPKTERYDGGANREVPLYPDLLPYIDAWWDACPEGCEHVIGSNRGTEAAWRTRMYKLLQRLGIPAWPKVFHNMRASSQTELEERFPSHVVCQWMGNSESVAREHYLQTTDDHFAQAIIPAKKNRRDLRRQIGQKPTEIDGKGFSKNRKIPENIEDFAKIDGGGWESNPPGAFADATPGLKPVAVTRAAYTPSSIIMASIGRECDTAETFSETFSVFSVECSVF